jgi:hypothetical protein
MDCFNSFILKRIIFPRVPIFICCLLNAQVEPPPPPPPPPSTIDTIGTTITDDTTGAIYEDVDVLATFPGGEKGWRKYLQKSLVYTGIINKAENKGIKSGTYTISVKFLVNIDGKIKDVKALTKYGYGLEEGAVEIIIKGGDWIPAEKGDKRVRSYRIQPITFIFGKF